MLGQGREAWRVLFCGLFSLVYCRRIWLIYAIWLYRVSIIQTVNFVLSLDILPRNYRHLWSQEHATLYLLYSCTQVRHARQKSNCFWNLSAKLKGERGESWTESWMRTNFLAEKSYQVRAKIHEASILPCAVAKSHAEGKRISQYVVITTFPSQFSPSLSVWGRTKHFGA